MKQHVPLLAALLWAASSFASVPISLHCPDELLKQYCMAEPVSEAQAYTAAHCVFWMELLRTIRPRCETKVGDFLILSAKTHPEFNFEGPRYYDIAHIEINGRFNEFSEIQRKNHPLVTNYASPRGLSGSGLFEEGKLIGILSRSIGNRSYFEAVY